MNTESTVENLTVIFYRSTHLRQVLTSYMYLSVEASTLPALTLSCAELRGKHQGDWPQIPLFNPFLSNPFRRRKGSGLCLCNLSGPYVLRTSDVLDALVWSSLEASVHEAQTRNPGLGCGCEHRAWFNWTRPWRLKSIPRNNSASPCAVTRDLLQQVRSTLLRQFWKEIQIKMNWIISQYSKPR